MNTTLAIQVTEDDIQWSNLNQGHGSSHKCPVAMAVKRAMRNRGYNAGPIFTAGGVGIEKGGPDLDLSKNDPALWSWQSAFDNRQNPPPQEFLLFLE